MWSLSKSDVFSSVRTIVQLTIVYFLHELPVNIRFPEVFKPANSAILNTFYD